MSLIMMSVKIKTMAMIEHYNTNSIVTRIIRHPTNTQLTATTNQSVTHQDRSIV